MMTIFGALTFVLVIYDVASVTLPEKIEDGGRDHRHELTTAEKHSFSNIRVDKTWYNYFSEDNTCDSIPMFTCNSIIINE